MQAAQSSEQIFDHFAPCNLTASSNLAPLATFPSEKISSKNFAAGTLQKARLVYLAKSLAIPNQNIPNSRLTLIRKLAWLLIIFQIMDGLLTLLGISFFGIEAEGNPLVRQIIHAMGPGFGIGLVKLTTIVIICCICIFGSKVSWLSRAMTGVASIYFFCALVPWSVVFGSYFGASLGIWL